MKRPILLLAAWLTLLGVAPGQKVQPHVTIRIATKLGVEKEFAASSSSTDDELLDSTLTSGGCRILIETKDAYFSIPVWDLKEVSITGTQMNATLTNGSTVQGRGFGSLRSEAGEQFALNSISRLTVVEMTKDYPGYVSSSAELPPQLWRVTLGTDATKSFVIKKPRFAFRYYSSAGYIMGGADHTETDSKVFWLKTGDEELEASLESFVKIVLTSSKVTVTAPNGTTTTGDLLLRSRDSKGWHGGSAWAIYGNVDGLSSTRILARNGPITIEQIR